MRWMPFKIAHWALGSRVTSLRPANAPGSSAPAGGRVLGALSLPAGFALAGFASAAELKVPAPIDPAAHYWPWIAGAVIVGLLGVVAFISRRRIHSVVGS